MFYGQTFVGLTAVDGEHIELEIGFRTTDSDEFFLDSLIIPLEDAYKISADIKELAEEMHISEELES